MLLLALILSDFSQRLKNIAANDLEETVFSDLGVVEKEKAQLDLNTLAELFTSSLEAVRYLSPLPYLNESQEELSSNLNKYSTFCIISP